MSRNLRIAAGTLAVLFAVAIVLTLVNRQDDMTPQEAKKHVLDFIESTVAHAVPDRSAMLRDPEGLRGSCHDAFGGMTDQTSRSYTLVLDGIDDGIADQIVARTDQVWRDRGLRVRHDNEDPGVSTILGSDDERDFGYNLTVNRNQGQVSFRGKTPCLDEDPASAAP